MPRAKRVEPVLSPEERLNVSELDSLIDQAGDASQGARALMEPQIVSAKRKRGRPSNAEKAVRDRAEPQPAETVAPSQNPIDCKPACRMVFGLTSVWIVRYTGQPQMGLMPEEIAGLGDAWGAVCEKYLPDFITAHGELMVAFAVTGTVGARLYTVGSELVEQRKAEMRVRDAQARARANNNIKPEVVSPALAN